MELINLTIKILNNNEKYRFEDIVFEDAVLKKTNKGYKIIKDRYGYFEGSIR